MRRLPQPSRHVSHPSESSYRLRVIINNHNNKTTSALSSIDDAVPTGT